jgi:hypothetical protein
VKLRTVGAGLLGLAGALVALWLRGPDPPALADAKPAQIDAEANQNTIANALADPTVVERTPEQPSLVPEPPIAAASGSVDATTISGRVINDIGEPVEGATVRAELQAEDIGEYPDPQALSDREGHFTLQRCASGGSYSLSSELKGLWLREHVLAATGVGDVELVLIRSGGIRGRVIEAFGSRVEDYVVVGRYEPPKTVEVPMTPERLARIQQAMRRQAHTQLVDIDEFRIQVMIEKLGAHEEQRPDGDAWAHLQPDGSFELTGLRPGKASVIVAARDRKQGLVTISGVDVLPATVGTDRRLNPVDLNPYACIYEVTVCDSEGNPTVAGKLECLATEQRAFSIEFKDGRARFVGNLRLLSITATAEGYQPVTVYSPAQIVTVTLRAE